jgi:hypothetical protein
MPAIAATPLCAGLKNIVSLRTTERKARGSNPHALIEGATSAYKAGPFTFLAAFRTGAGKPASSIVGMF